MIFQIDQIVRYGEGHTALMRVTKVDEDYCHGEQCFGGSRSIRLHKITPATPDDLVVWSNRANFRSKSPKTFDYYTFSKINRRRCDRWHAGKQWSLSDWATALTGELGEACNIIKKLNRIRDDMNTQNHDEEKLMAELALELADTFTYLDLLATGAGIDLPAAVIKKFNIVSERYGFPEKLTEVL